MVAISVVFTRKSSVTSVLRSLISSSTSAALVGALEGDIVEIIKGADSKLNTFFLMISLLASHSSFLSDPDPNKRVLELLTSLLAATSAGDPEVSVGVISAARDNAPASVSALVELIVKAIVGEVVGIEKVKVEDSAMKASRPRFVTTSLLIWSLLFESDPNKIVFEVLTSLLADTSESDPEMDIEDDPSLPILVTLVVEAVVEADVALTVEAGVGATVATRSFLPDPAPNKIAFSLLTSLLAATSAAVPKFETDENPDLPEFAVGISVGADVGEMVDAADPSVTALVWAMVEADVTLAVAAGVGAGVLTETSTFPFPSNILDINPLRFPAKILSTTSLAPTPVAEHKLLDE